MGEDLRFFGPVQTNLIRDFIFRPYRIPGRSIIRTSRYEIASRNGEFISLDWIIGVIIVPVTHFAIRYRRVHLIKLYEESR